MRCNSDHFTRAVGVVEAFLKAEKLHACEIAVALSGGADSVFLTRALSCLAAAHRLTVSAIHVNHGIRGAEADRDAAFCRALCMSLDIRYEQIDVDVPSYAKSYHMSLESAARDLRYAGFEKYFSAHPGALIATAHQADDHAETVVFRMARGTGLHGLCGIPSRRGRFIRPCLQLTADEVRLALDERNYAYCKDSTNDDVSYARNYVRHRVMPELAGVHENAVKNISLMTEGLREDEAFLSGLAEDLLKQAEAAHLRSVIAAQPNPIAKRMLLALYEPVRRSTDAMTTVQLSAALELVRCGEHHARMTLPCGVEMRLEGESLCFGTSHPISHLATTPVTMGVTQLDEAQACIILSEVPITKENFPILNIYKLLIQSTLYFDKMDASLFVRARQEGDAYRYGGMTHRVKKMYNDRKMTLVQRATHPILCDADGILWIPGFGVREGADQPDDMQKKVRIYACYCSMMEAFT